MTKQSYQMIFSIDTYQDENYDANLFPSKEFNSLSKDDKLSILEAMQKCIELNADLITG
jgi:hypothetical protein